METSKTSANQMDETICLSQLINIYLKEHAHLFRPSTNKLHQTMLRLIESEEFGSRSIRDITTCDAKLWFIALHQKGKSYHTLHNLRGVLRPAFQMCMEADLLPNNPFNFPLSSVCKLSQTSKTVYTEEQRDLFLELLKSDSRYSKYYEGIYILFHTGIRISEFCALSESDIDFQNKILKIDKQLLRLGSSQYYIQSTKTSSGTREIPINQKTADAFTALIRREKNYGKHPEISGLKGFFYIDANGHPTVAQHWEGYFKSIHKSLQSKYPEVLFPPITPHICRHSYCSILAAKGMTPKHLQYLMGHSSINITMNVYTHVNLSNIQKELKNLGA